MSIEKLEKIINFLNRNHIRPVVVKGKIVGLQRSTLDNTKDLLPHDFINLK